MNLFSLITWINVLAALKLLQSAFANSYNVLNIVQKFAKRLSLRAKVCQTCSRGIRDIKYP